MNALLKFDFTSKKYILTLIITISLLFVIGGSIYFGYEENHISTEKHEELKAIADLKINQIMQWRMERLGNARILSESPFIIRAIQELIVNPNNLTIKNDLIARFNLLVNNYGYEDIYLTSIQGDIFFSAKNEQNKFEKLTTEEIVAAVKRKKHIFFDYYSCTSHNKVHFEIMAPVLNHYGNPLAVIVLRIDPNDYLYPLIQTWPTPSKTSETIIVQREGDTVVFLNEMRHIKNTALSFKIPITDKNIPAVKAVLGYIGIFKGIDYRGVPVLSYINFIPGSNWYIISKVDRAEIYEDLYYREATIIGLTLLLILFTGIGFTFIYKIRIITERQRAEEKLRQSEERFKLVIENSSDGINLLDLQSRNYTFMSPSQVAMTGFKREEILGMSAEEAYARVHPEDRNISVLQQQQIEAGLIIDPIEYRWKVKSGEYRWFSDNRKLVKNSKGNPIALVGISRDITHRKLAELALKYSEERFRQVSESSGEWIWEVDTNGLYTYASPIVEKILGYTSDEIVGKLHFYDLFLPDTREELKNSVLGIINRKEAIKNLPNANLSKDGKIIILETSGLPILDGIGNLLGYRGADTDITERTKTEVALKESEKRYRELTEQLPLSLYEADLNGNVNYANHAAFELFGYNPDDFLEGINIFQLIANDDTVKAKENFSSIIKGGPTTSTEILVQKKDGSIFPTIAYSNVKYKDGKPEGIRGFIFDISERKRIEEDFRKNEELLRTVLNNAPITIFATDCRGVFTLSEGKKLELVGLNPGENVGESAFELFGTLPFVEHNGNVSNGNDIIRRVLEGETVTAFSELLSVHFDNSFVPLRTKDGNINGLIGVATDITERKRAEDVLVKLRKAIDSSAEAIFITDKEGIFTFVNPAFIALYGFTSEEIVGKSTPRIIKNGKYKQSVYEVFWKTLLRGEEIKGEIINKRKDGTLINIESSATPIIDEEKKIIGFLGIQRDITERKVALEEIKKAHEQLEQLYIYEDEIKENERAAIAREIHDELGQSLTAIKIDLGWTKNNIGNNPELKKKIDGMIDIVTVTIKNVQRISSDLRPGLLDDLGLIPAIEWYIQEFEKRSSIKCHLKLDDVQIPSMKKNLALYRIIQESLTNVIRHAKANIVNIKLCQIDDSVILEITDDGVGIKQEKINSRVSLGLIGISERVKQFNGSLDITSAKNKGTKLSIIIPIN